MEARVKRSKDPGVAEGPTAKKDGEAEALRDGRMEEAEEAERREKRKAARCIFRGRGEKGRRDRGRGEKGRREERRKRKEERRKASHAPAAPARFFLHNIIIRVMITRRASHRPYFSFFFFAFLFLFPLS